MNKEQFPIFQFSFHLTFPFGVVGLVNRFIFDGRIKVKNQTIFSFNCELKFKSFDTKKKEKDNKKKEKVETNCKEEH